MPPPIIESVTSALPFVSCVVNGDNGKKTPAATRLTEVLLILAFVWWQVDKIDERLASVEKNMNVITATVTANSARLEERYSSTRPQR